MQANIIHIGLDVDDTNYHGSALDKHSGECLSFKCRPTLKGLLSQLNKLQKQFPGTVFHLCYEASYIGYTLQRDLSKQGFHCDVVAPTSIPSPRGKQIKTDRIDAAQLVQFYANGLLTLVGVPETEQEQDRDLLRTRKRLVKHQAELRSHLQALLRRHGLHYRAQTGYKSHWTKLHYSWLRRTVETTTGSLKISLDVLLRQLGTTDRTIAEYDQHIEALAKSPRYEEAVKALVCYKGIKNHYALTLITEIGDIKRFPHPRQLVSWAGMDIREYSSGGKHNRFGITKHGNKFLRTALIEANQRGYRTTRITKDLSARRSHVDAELVNIADRCLRRLHKKGTRLLDAGKHPNKIKVACAREMAGFIWESLNKVAA